VTNKQLEEFDFQHNLTLFDKEKIFAQIGVLAKQALALVVLAQTPFLEEFASGPRAPARQHQQTAVRHIAREDAHTHRTCYLPSEWATGRVAQRVRRIKPGLWGGCRMLSHTRHWG
jgi:hypothetical protein